MKSFHLFMVFMAFGLIVQTASAQVSLGVRGGIYRSNIQATEGLNDFSPDFKALDNYTFGAVVEVPIFSNLYFQPELNYTVKGFGLTANSEFNLFNTPLSVGAQANSRFHYLDVPLLAKAKFGGDAVQLYLLAGPAFGYALNGTLETRIKAIVDIKVSDTNINLENIDYERFEISGVLGAGLNIDLNLFQLFADVRYQHGFTQLYDIPQIEDSVKNKGIALSAGIMIPIGK